jgi:hypothetical protein
MIEWLLDPKNAGVIEAMAAIAQAVLAIGIVIATAFSVRLSRQTLNAYRKELLDASLPALIFQLWPSPSENEDEMTSTTDLRVLNAGRGVALNIACKWEPASSVELVHSTPPIALNVGESFLLTYRWNVFLGMSHDFPGTSVDRKDAEGRTLMRLGTIRARYRDIHFREVTSSVNLEFLYIGLKEPERDAEGWIRVSRESEYASVSLTDLEFVPPAERGGPQA